MIQTNNFCDISLFTLSNNKGVSISITNYGGIITSILAPDKNGSLDDIALGYNTLSEYMNATEHPYFGAIIGRYGNRIANGGFSIDGEPYQLTCNNDRNHLHGGLIGFDRKIWSYDLQTKNNLDVLNLKYLSSDGEEGYPGNLFCEVDYSLNEESELKIEYYAKCDRKTIYNPTNHTYFNLNGEGNGDILDHYLRINAEEYLSVNQFLIPTGDFTKVDNTPFDFRQSKKIGLRINEEHPQLKLGMGYDHCYVLENKGNGLKSAAFAYSELSGRTLEVLTNEPGVQLYSGNFLTGNISAKKQGVYAKRGGFCLETQHYPNSPNIKHFPSTLLEPNVEFRSSTIYKFGIMN